MHKPAQQTIVPGQAVRGLLEELPIGKLRGLGGQFGEDVMRTLGITTVGQLAAVPYARLESLFGESCVLMIVARVWVVRVSGVCVLSPAAGAEVGWGGGRGACAGVACLAPSRLQASIGW